MWKKCREFYLFTLSLCKMIHDYCTAFKPYGKIQGTATSHLKPLWPEVIRVSSQKLPFQTPLHAHMHLEMCQSGTRLYVLFKSIYSKLYNSKAEVNLKELLLNFR